ncbi:hypothetical protein M0R45_015709 [Rubus argutus]|uniref:V-SNARE coiled-coil homology domain-containing protein n=1 Tax=Rubus argutus TaxID=59490 RepID=A0AAW1XSW1_RUBAR
MVDNIEKILERGDRIELLVDKTATMQDGAFHFKKQSKRLRRALWMKNAKLLFSYITSFLPFNKELDLVKYKAVSRIESSASMYFRRYVPAALWSFVGGNFLVNR